MNPPAVTALRVATNPNGPAIADDSISRTAVNADDPAEMSSGVPAANLPRSRYFPAWPPIWPHWHPGWNCCAPRPATC